MLGRYLRNTLKIEPSVSLAWWIFERITNNWLAVTAIAGGGVMSVLGALSEWVAPWGPVGWGALFLFGAFSVAAIYAVFAWASSRRLMNRYARDAVDSSGVNPLNDRFEGRVIALRDFYSPYVVANRKKAFYRCRLVGPANIVLSRSSILGGDVRRCQVVIVHDDIETIHGASLFDECTFVETELLEMTFMMTRAAYDAIEDPRFKALPVINGPQSKAHLGSSNRL